MNIFSKHQIAALLAALVSASIFYLLPLLLISRYGLSSPQEIAIMSLAYPVPFIVCALLLANRLGSKNDFSEHVYTSNFIGAICAFSGFFAFFVLSGAAEPNTSDYVPGEAYLVLFFLLVIAPIFMFSWLFKLLLKLLYP